MERVARGVMLNGLCICLFRYIGYEKSIVKSGCEQQELRTEKREKFVLIERKSERVLADS